MKVTGVGGIVELGSAKGDCRLREFARFSFVLSVAEQKSFDFFGVLLSTRTFLGTRL